MKAGHLMAATRSFMTTMRTAGGSDTARSDATVGVARLCGVRGPASLVVRVATFKSKMA